MQACELPCFHYKILKIYIFNYGGKKARKSVGKYYILWMITIFLSVHYCSYKGFFRIW
jgi:hypothetical protein